MFDQRDDAHRPLAREGRHPEPIAGSKSTHQTSPRFIDAPDQALRPGAGEVDRAPGLPSPSFLICAGDDFVGHCFDYCNHAY